MDIDKILAGRCPPVTQQARFDVAKLERLFQERIVKQGDLTDRQIVRCTPPCLDQAHPFGREQTIWDWQFSVFRHDASSIPACAPPSSEVTSVFSSQSPSCLW